MIWMENWLLAVLQLFDDTLRTMMAQPFLAFFLGFQVFLVIIGLLASMIRAGKKV